MCVIHCAFCTEIARGSRRVVYESTQLIAFPTIGCFIRGYLLLLPKVHVTSYAQLGSSYPQIWNEVAAIAQEVGALVQSPVIIGEHGTGTHGRSSCCTGYEHAHLHIIPVPSPAIEKVVDRFVQVGGSPSQIKVEDLKKYKNYSYNIVITSLPSAYLWTGDAFPSQFIRKVCAEVLGITEYDWRQHPFRENMEETIRLLKPSLERIKYGGNEDEDAQLMFAR